MSNELSTGKTIFILAVVVGCFAVLWPRVFYPMLAASVKSSPSPAPHWRDAANSHHLVQLCFLLEEQRDPLAGLERWTDEDCLKQVKKVCGVVLTERILEGFRLEKDKTNLTNCLRFRYDLTPQKVSATAPPPTRTKPYQPHPTSQQHARPERSPHLQPEELHPALREKGRAMPQRTIEKEARPGPMPGVRPPMGGGSHMVPPQSKGSGAMGIIMPLYTVGIVIFFIYTIMKILFKKNTEDEKTPKLKDFHLDPEYRKYVFAEEYLDSANASHRDLMRRNEKEASRQRRRQETTPPDTKIVSSAISLILEDLERYSKDTETKKEVTVENKKEIPEETEYQELEDDTDDEYEDIEEAVDTLQNVQVRISQGEKICVEEVVSHAENTNSETTTSKREPPSVNHIDKHFNDSDTSCYYDSCHSSQTRSDNKGCEIAEQALSSRLFYNDTDCREQSESALTTEDTDTPSEESLREFVTEKESCDLHITRSAENFPSCPQKLSILETKDNSDLTISSSECNTAPTDNCFSEYRQLLSTDYMLCWQQTSYTNSEVLCAEHVNTDCAFRMTAVSEQISEDLDKRTLSEILSSSLKTPKDEIISEKSDATLISDTNESENCMVNFHTVSSEIKKNINNEIVTISTVDTSLIDVDAHSKNEISKECNDKSTSQSYEDLGNTEYSNTGRLLLDSSVSAVESVDAGASEMADHPIRDIERHITDTNNPCADENKKDGTSNPCPDENKKDRTNNPNADEKNKDMPDNLHADENKKDTTDNPHAGENKKDTTDNLHADENKKDTTDNPHAGENNKNRSNSPRADHNNKGGTKLDKNGNCSNRKNNRKSRRQNQYRRIENFIKRNAEEEAALMASKGLIQTDKRSASTPEQTEEHLEAEAKGEEETSPTSTSPSSITQSLRHTETSCKADIGEFCEESLPCCTSKVEELDTPSTATVEQNA